MRFKNLNKLVAYLLLATSVAQAAPGEWVNQVTPIIRPAGGSNISLSDTKSLSPDSESWAQTDPLSRMVYNINNPTMELITPKSDLDRPAILVIPGGGFEFLAIDNEGFLVARKLQALGFSVYILKYRTIPMVYGFESFHEALVALFQRGELPSQMRDAQAVAAEDAQSAIATLRNHSKEWHIDPKHIGVIGFSAGAITVLNSLDTKNILQRPDFAAMIYGPTQIEKLPAQTPPLFAAIAAEDRFFKNQNLSLIERWRQSGASIEFHLYSNGGHGFASQPSGATSDLWFQEFAAWVQAHHLN